MFQKLRIFVMRIELEKQGADNFRLYFENKFSAPYWRVLISK